MVFDGLFLELLGNCSCWAIVVGTVKVQVGVWGLQGHGISFPSSRRLECMLPGFLTVSLRVQSAKLDCVLWVLGPVPKPSDTLP